MWIISNNEQKRMMGMVNQAFIEGYNLAKKELRSQLERELERGRITVNEYRRLAYDLPPIEKSANIEVMNERVSR